MSILHGEARGAIFEECFLHDISPKRHFVHDNDVGMRLSRLARSF
jgi:hypothetical protein